MRQAAHAATPEAAQALAAGLPDLLAAAERLAFIAVPGRHGRRRTGLGEAFWQYREFSQSDDPRRIDWRRSAMGSRIFVREREHDVQAGFSLRLHDGPGMGFRGASGLPTKRDRAILLLLALAALLLRAGERVALAGRTPPLAGGNALRLLAAAFLSNAAAAVDPRARRIDFGDFLLPEPRFAGPPGGAVLQILDPAECDFPYAGRTVFIDYGDAPALEAADAAAWMPGYRDRIAAQREAVAAAARAAGQTPLFHRGDSPPAAALAALYLALRDR